MGHEAAASLRTLRDVLRYAVSRFSAAQLHFGHGTDNAFDEAAYLLLHTLKLPLERLEPFLDATLLPDEIEQLLAIVERRVRERLPAAYLTHEAWLGEHRFYVDQRVLVPRSHIAELIGEVLSAWIPEPERVERILDLCTGSGCLAILLALQFASAEVDATDVSPEALEVARRNVADYGLGARVKLLQSDLFVGLDGQRYDLIVSNPPYVSAQAMRELPDEHLREPALALAGGEDGLDLVRRILGAARPHLKPGGLLVVEVGHGRPVLERSFPELSVTWLETSAGDDQVFLIEQGQLPT